MFDKPCPPDAAGHAGCVQQVGHREATGGEVVGIDLHLILPDPAAEDGHRRDPFHAEQAGAQLPLDAVPQLDRRELVGCKPGGQQSARGGSQRCDSWRFHADRQLAGQFGEPLGHHLPRPVHVGAAAENEGDDGQPLDRLRPGHLEARQAADGGFDRGSHQLFDFSRRQAGCFGLDSHLRGRELGEHVQCGVLGGIVPGNEQRHGQDDDHEPLADGPLDDCLEHVSRPPLWPGTPPRAAPGRGG